MGLARARATADALRKLLAMARIAGSAFFHDEAVEPPTHITASSEPSGCTAATSVRRGTSVPPGLSAEKETSIRRLPCSVDEESTCDTSRRTLPRDARLVCGAAAVAAARERTAGAAAKAGLAVRARPGGSTP